MNNHLAKSKLKLEGMRVGASVYGPGGFLVILYFLAVAVPALVCCFTGGVM